MNTTTDAPNLADASNDDLKAMGLPPAFTLEELQAALSEEEIAKLAEGDDPLVKLPGAAAKAGEADPDDEDEDEDEDDPDDEKGDGDKAEAEAGDPTKAAQATDDTPDPVYEPRDVSQFEAIVSGAADERKALRTAYDDGEMTDEEFDRKLDEIADKVADAKAEIKDAKREEDRSLDAVKAAWFDKVDSFLEANPAFSDNTPIAQLEGNSYLTALDTVMKSVNQDPRYAGLSMSKRIETSAQIVRAYVQQQTGADMPGFAPAEKTAKADKQPDPQQDARDKARDKVKEQGKRPDPVQTLGNVTAATETEADNSRFASIDREKSALDREREFGRLSPEEQDAFLKGI